MKRLLREPLLHFLVLGAAIFALSMWKKEASPDPVAGTRIVITPGHIQQMITGFSRTWQRPPTSLELDALVQNYVREEVLSREAAAAGLDRDDTIIRRRLRQKMEFLMEDVSELESPTEATLKAFLKENPQKFREDPRVSFRHVYFNRERRGSAAPSQAREALARLNSTAPEETEGDGFLLPMEFTRCSRSEIVGMFGETFAGRLQEAVQGSWTGPLESPFGLHLVLVKEWVDGRLPELVEVRAAVEREWSSARTKVSTEAAYRRLRERYTVVIQDPKGVSTPSKP